MKRRIYLAGLIVATAIAMEPSAIRLTAFTTNGHIWGVKQVPYYINPANKYISDTSAVAAITSAASTWKGVANISLVYAGYTNRSSLTNDGVNAVFFRDDSSGSIAETYWWWDGTGHLVDADIVYHENYKFYSGNFGCNGDGYYVENTGAHEFGHVLGLGHSSVDTAAMWPYSGACETIRETLDPDDVAGLQSLYGGSTSSTTAPSAPSGLTAAAASASPTSSIAMSWADNATNESGYNVERSSDGASFSQRAQLAAGATSYVDTGLASSATYYYRVSAFNSAGSSAYSNVASGVTQASTPTTTVPSAPSGLTATAASASPTSSIAMSWADNATNESGYVVERSADGSTFSQRAQLASGATSWSIRAFRPARLTTIASTASTAPAHRRVRTSHPPKLRPRRLQRRPRPARPRARHRPMVPRGSTGTSRSRGPAPTRRATTCF